MTALPEDQPLPEMPEPAPGADVAPTGPAPLAAGTFAIYEDGQGGYVLVTDMPGSGVQRKHIPAALVKLVTGGGVLSRRLGAIFGA